MRSNNIQHIANTIGQEMTHLTGSDLKVRRHATVLLGRFLFELDVRHRSTVKNHTFVININTQSYIRNFY